MYSTVRFRSVWWWRSAAIAFVLALVSAMAANAQWIQDGAPVVAGPGVQDNNAITTDGASGAIVVWVGGEVYVQRIDAGGFTQWAINQCRNKTSCSVVNHVFREAGRGRPNHHAENGACEVNRPRPSVRFRPYNVFVTVVPDR
ncbi:MAG: hypothetical protein O7G86_04905, partial [Gammaproteobacteria bacterium]|nr:hypothetical protein [Gammaproteobacteria bacterium]